MMKFPKLKCNIFCASAVVVILIGLWQAYKPLILKPDVFTETMQSIQQVRSDFLPKYLANSIDKPTLIYAYASWCPNCALTTPLLARKIRGNEMSDVNVIFMAWEQSKYELAHYLTSKNYNGLWTPYLMDKPIGSTLQIFGASHIPGVPYLGLFDESGYKRLEILGKFTEQELDSVLQYAGQGQKGPMSLPDGHTEEELLKLFNFHKTPQARDE